MSGYLVTKFCRHLTLQLTSCLGTWSKTYSEASSPTSVFWRDAKYIIARRSNVCASAVKDRRGDGLVPRLVNQKRTKNNNYVHT